MLNGRISECLHSLPLKTCRWTTAWKTARSKLRAIRGDTMSMIFQDPIAGLNPVVSVGVQVDEVIANHRETDDEAAQALTLEALRHVGLPDPEPELQHSSGSPAAHRLACYNPIHQEAG